jgi:hypothetical protein
MASSSRLISLHLVSSRLISSHLVASHRISGGAISFSSAEQAECRAEHERLYVEGAAALAARASAAAEKVLPQPVPRAVLRGVRCGLWY